jgi:hypothetical protein
MESQERLRQLRVFEHRRVRPVKAPGMPAVFPGIFSDPCGIR